MEYLGDIERMISAVAAIGAVAMSIFNSRKIKEVHISINSRMDQLLKARGEASKAEGVEQGRNESTSTPDESPVKVEIVKIPPIPQA